MSEDRADRRHRAFERLMAMRERRRRAAIAMWLFFESLDRN